MCDFPKLGHNHLFTLWFMAKSFFLSSLITFNTLSLSPSALIKFMNWVSYITTILLLYSHSLKFVMAPITPLNYMFTNDFMIYCIIDKEDSTNNCLPWKAITISLSCPLSCKCFTTSLVVHFTGEAILIW